MPSLLNKNDKENNFYWLRQTYVDNIPADCRAVYYRLLNNLVVYNKKLITAIIENSGAEISFPMEIDLIESYLTGFEINYIGFNDFFGSKSGYLEIDEEDENVVTIFFNTYDSPKRQRYTKIHETLHFCQSLDDSFQYFFDELLTNSTLPLGVVIHLMEKATDKATAMYLMPNNYFNKKWREVGSISVMSEYFQVSEQSVAYRLKECGITIIN